MAGPGIRYRQFALQLADRFDVTLVVPNEPDDDLPGVRLVARRISATDASDSSSSRSTPSSPSS